jgi:hypothetical protein
MSTKKTGSNTKTTIVIVSKTGTLSECIVEPTEDTTLEQLTVLLSKKCGYRNHDGFSCYHTWRYKNKSKRNSKKRVFSLNETEHEHEPIIPKYIYIDVWAKTDGRAGNENKYELPPPIDELIIFGNIALVARIDNETAVDLTVEMWNVIYENLFGGFEDLATSAVEDENEIDELDSIPQHKKTSNGYLKDGFIVEDDDDDSLQKTSRRRFGKKKNKSESTESEFITETETETDTETLTLSSSDTPDLSDIDKEQDVSASKKAAAAAAAAAAASTKKRKQTVSNKKSIEEPITTFESETELTEEEYV